MTTRPRSGRGRRPGAPDTRAEILRAARELFAERGLAGTSVRGVAAGAGVDPSLVHHYFGSKDDLFMAALELPVDPRALLAPVLAGGAERAGEHLLQVLIGAWDDPENQPSLLGLFRSAMEPAGDRRMTEGFLPLVIGPMGESLGLDRPEARMPLVVSQVLGLIATRYVLRLEPVASMDRDRLVATYAPTLQRYLTGDLPGLPPRP